MVTRREVLWIGAGAGATVALATEGIAPALAQAAGPADARPTFTLVTVNDIDRMGEVRGRGGFARLAAVVRSERAKGVPTLFIHAGDMFSPSLLSGFDRGAHTVELLNVTPPDIFVPGNHEFDFGPEAYAQRVREARFPFFAANLRTAAGGSLPAHHDRRLIDLGPVKVGVFGVTLAGTPAVSSPGPDLRFGEEIATVRDQAAALRREGADLVLCAAHIGFEADLQVYRSRLVDMLITGHDHDLRMAYDKRALMSESGEQGETIVCIDVFAEVATVEGRRRVTWLPRFRPIDSATVTPDPEVAAIVQRYEGELSRELDVELGVLGSELDSRPATVRSQEAAIGNMIADALRAATGADVALQNGGGIRADKVYPPGHRLTRRDILSELPFGNVGIMVEITGADLRAALENGFSQIETRAGRFPQMAGARVVVDAKAPAGSRIVSVEVGGQPLDPARTYRVAANDFMLAGGDGYTTLGRGRVIIDKNAGSLLASIVMSHVRERGIVIAATDGRITIR